MAHPIGNDGLCTVCKESPSLETTFFCVTCMSPWHVTYLASAPIAQAINFECRTCSLRRSLVAPVEIEEKQPLSAEDEAMWGPFLSKSSKDRKGKRKMVEEKGVGEDGRRKGSRRRKQALRSGDRGGAASLRRR